ncbi:MAG: hypothetical protein ACO1QB_08675 [Verrucomicrobiales bacterium]
MINIRRFMPTMSLRSVIATLLAVGSLTLVGCKEKGPMEQAGENIDKAFENTKEATKEGVEKVGEAAEKAGDKVKDATN